MTVKRKQMDRTTLKSIIRAHRADSLGVEDGELSSERAKALDHYHGRPYGNEVEGRSQVVSRDLAEAVDWALPGIMRVFVASGNLGEFDPIGPEDEQLAIQESDYINQVLMRDNNGFMVLHDAIKDTLLLKNGYVKHFWDETEKIDEAEYSGLSMEQITMMLQDLERKGSEVEIVGQESYFVDLGQMPGMPPMQQNPAQQVMQPMMVELFDIRLKVMSKKGKLVWLAVPSEEVRVSKKCRGSLQESPFTEHVTKKTRSDLIEMGMPFDFVYSLASVNEAKNSGQTYARDSVSEESDNDGSAATGDKSMDEIEYCEAYIRVDYDGDGVAELRKVVTVGDEIPAGEDWNEPIPAVPMTTFVAKRVPHRHVGESLDDELADLQEIMTVLKRQLLDNIYRINNAEMAVNENANIRDFLTSTPGGVKRIKGKEPVGNAFMPIQTTPIIDKLLPVVDHFERAKESRTGIGKTSGVDPDALQNTTKGAFLENLNRATQKQEMIARMLAETGVKEVLIQSHAILTRHQDKARMVQMRGKWVNVNPQEWKERTDLTVKVGLGAGNQEEQREKLMLLSQLQDKLGAMGLVSPKEGYALFEDTAKALGFDIPDKYVLAPGTQAHTDWQNQQKQTQQQTNQLAEAEQVKAQAAMAIAQARQEAQMQIEGARQQFNRDKEMLNAQVKQRDAEEDRRLQIVLERMKQQGEDNRAAMANEVKMILEGMRIDLGRPGIGAGVQGAAGTPLGGEQHMMPSGEMMQGPPMDQQTMPPDGQQP